MELFIIFCFAILWLYLFTDTFTRNRFKIKELKLLGKAIYVNKFHKKGERLLIILYVIFCFIAVVYYGNIFHYNLLFLIMIGIFRAFMEWKFERASKQYVLSILFTVFCLILFIGFQFFIKGNFYSTVIL